MFYSMQVHLLGLPVRQLVGFLPPPNGCPLGVAVTSYRGRLQLSVNADASALERFRRALPAVPSGPRGLQPVEATAASAANADASARGANGAQVLLERVEAKLNAIAAEGHRVLRK
jgi:hypothetical protein